MGLLENSDSFLDLRKELFGIPPWVTGGPTTRINNDTCIFMDIAVFVLNNNTTTLRIEKVGSMNETAMALLLKHCLTFLEIQPDSMSVLLVGKFEFLLAWLEFWLLPNEFRPLVLVTFVMNHLGFKFEHRRQEFVLTIMNHILTLVAVHIHTLFFSPKVCVQPSFINHRRAM
jgi:hypothetical protein